MNFAARGMRTVVRLVMSLGSETGGNISIIAALIGPSVILLAIGAVDLAAVSSARARLQSIADAGALAGARHLVLATDGAAAKEQAASFVQAETSQWDDAPSFRESYEIIDQGGQRAISVILQANMPSFFVNLLPPGGWNFTAEATATSVGLVPLCVLLTGTTGIRILHVKDSGRMAAPSCLVHSNRDIAVQGGGITASAVQAVTSAVGAITPLANTGAAPIDDPFAGIDLDRAIGAGGTCNDLRAASEIVRVSTGTHYIQPGKHCGSIEATGDARIVLNRGEHYFLMGQLLIDESARLEGQDVVLIFDVASRFSFNAAARINLEGRQSGAFAGLVMATVRDNQQDFLVSADHVESLLGVIYVPSARLIVEGSADVARDSAWTVIVAKELLLRGSPSLFINANYNASSVPVPAGVGPRAGGSRLTY
ncbi:Putative Flp pilus-assembly TadG-like, N-terminal [Caulobacteraceae bacterium]